MVQLILDESRAVVRAERGVLITETRAGWICANAGIDASNVPGSGRGRAAPRGRRRLGPADPRRDSRAEAGVAPAVVVADSFGRPWRVGQADVAIGCAGLRAVDDWRGRADAEGRELAATVVADRRRGGRGRRPGPRQGSSATAGGAWSAALGEHVDRRGRPRRRAALRRAQAEDLFRWLSAGERVRLALVGVPRPPRRPCPACRRARGCSRRSSPVTSLRVSAGPTRAHHAWLELVLLAALAADAERRRPLEGHVDLLLAVLGVVVLRVALLVRGQLHQLHPEGGHAEARAHLATAPRGSTSRSPRCVFTVTSAIGPLSIVSKSRRSRRAWCAAPGSARRRARLRSGPPARGARRDASRPCGRCSPPSASRRGR